MEKSGNFEIQNEWQPSLDDLDLFYDKVNFGNIGFYIEKGENNGYFGNYCSLRPESWQMQTTNEVNKGV